MKHERSSCMSHTMSKASSVSASKKTIWPTNMRHNIQRGQADLRTRKVRNDLVRKTSNDKNTEVGAQGTLTRFDQVMRRHHGSVTRVLTLQGTGKGARIRINKRWQHRRRGTLSQNPQYTTCRSGRPSQKAIHNRSGIKRHHGCHKFDSPPQEPVFKLRREIKPRGCTRYQRRLESLQGWTSVELRCTRLIVASEHKT